MNKTPDKEAADKTAVSEETSVFTEWMLMQQPMSAHAVESFVNRNLGIKTAPPIKKVIGPRFKDGDLIEIKAEKHTGPDKDVYIAFDGKTGTVESVDGDDVLVIFSGLHLSVPVRFTNGMKPKGVGIYKYTAPYTIEGSDKIELVYVADPSAQVTEEAKEVVQNYKDRAKGSERRSENLYTGYVTSAFTGVDGSFYFKLFPQQRVDPKSEAGYQSRTINPSKGRVHYIGLFGKRPNNWEAEMAKASDKMKKSGG